MAKAPAKVRVGTVKELALAFDFEPVSFLDLLWARYGIQFDSITDPMERGLVETIAQQWAYTGEEFPKVEEPQTSLAPVVTETGTIVLPDRRPGGLAEILLGAADTQGIDMQKLMDE